MGRVSATGRLTLTHSPAPLTPLLLPLQGLVAEFLASNVDWLGAQVPGAKLEQIAESMQPVVYEDGQVAFRSGDTANSLMVITKGAAKYVPRIGGSGGGGAPAEETLGVGAMVAAGSHVQEALLSLLHTQHEGARSPLRCLQGNSHVGSVTAVGTLHCACMSVWEFANFLASLPAVIGTQRGIATLCKGLAIFQNCTQPVRPRDSAQLLRNYCAIRRTCRAILRRASAPLRSSTGSPKCSRRSTSRPGP